MESSTTRTRTHSKTGSQQYSRLQVVSEEDSKEGGSRLPLSKLKQNSAYGSLFGYVYSNVHNTTHDSRLKPARLTVSPSSVVRPLHIVPAWCEHRLTSIAMHSPRIVQHDSGGETISTNPTLARIAPPVLSSAYNHGTPRKMTRAFLRTSGVQRGLGNFSNMKCDGCFQDTYSASLCP